MHDPDNDSLQKIANYFNVTTDYLLGRAKNSATERKTSPVLDDEALELMEQMHKRPELKVLFQTAKKARKEDVEFTDQLLRRMAGIDASDQADSQYTDE